MGAVINRIGAFYLEMAKAADRGGRGPARRLRDLGRCGLQEMHLHVAAPTGASTSSPGWRGWSSSPTQHGLPVIYHGCGNVKAIFPTSSRWASTPTTRSKPRPGMDVVELRRRYGHRIAFCGNSDIQVWESGDRDAIRREVLRKLNAAKGGGFIFQSDHSVSSARLRPHLRLHRQAGPRVRQLPAPARRIRQARRMP